ncbi:tRNA (adenosine(37)-N6)-threonylcarbamoyltransferase complex transferase subunit TsaD [Melioribacter sp. OK-6-Me]|uniref:tRNA (adenosine(37)-N6)-threonylcarbamoyltransferase complex transferase subunit TsaD n=1 Tax=unclassified Melioribacter TaxID=2627329 RepID=UPI003ED8DC4F
MNILGIETSCDETSVAVISDGRLMANLISSQDFHTNYGGVVPELSSRAHLQILMPLINKALDKTGLKLDELDVISATAGPGLIGALLVGLTFGKGLAYSLGKTFIPVNHIEGHIFSGFLMEEKPDFPYLCLVVSGGHTLLLLVKSDYEIIKLGTTIDDAAGEAFDKVSKMLGLGYPGGPMIQKYAEMYKGELIDFPVSRCKNKYDFSFSGLKTAVLRFIEKQYGGVGRVPIEELPLLAASFQSAAVRALAEKTEVAISEFNPKSLSLVGGVAANIHLRNTLNEMAKKYNKKFIVPSIDFCGDNAAMIAYRGMKLYEGGYRFNFDFNAYPGLKENPFIKEYKSAD